MSDLHITVVGPVAYTRHVETGEFTRKDGTKVDVIVRVTKVFRKINGSGSSSRNTCLFLWTSILAKRICFPSRDHAPSLPLSGPKFRQSLQNLCGPVRQILSSRTVSPRFDVRRLRFMLA